MRKHYKPLLLAAFLLVVGVAATQLPLGQMALTALSWVESHPTTAWAVYIVSYIAAAVMLVPGSILTLAAGFLFGLPLGVAVVSAGSALGAAAAFLVGRFLARDWVRERIASLPRFQALDRATQHEGFLIVFLVRLSPLFPFNLINYGLGLTAVRFKHYFFASWLGMLPATVAYVYVGTLAKNLTEITTGQVEGGWAGQALLVVGFIATVGLTILITRKATHALKTHLQAESAQAESTRAESTQA